MVNFLKEVLDIAVKYKGYFLQGIGYTMLIALAGTIIGLVIGLITGIIRTIPKSKNPIMRGFLKVVNFIISAYVEIFRGTPMMVQSMVIFWGYEQRRNTAADSGRYLHRVYQHGCLHG